MVEAQEEVEKKRRNRSRTLSISEEAAAAERSRRLREKRRAAGWVYVETMVPSAEAADVLYEAAARMRDVVKEKADREFERKKKYILSLIEEIRSTKTETFSGIAAELNRRGAPPLRRGRWHARQVQLLLEESVSQQSGEASAAQPSDSSRTPAAAGRKHARPTTEADGKATPAKSQRLRDKRKAAGWVYVETMVPSREEADILYDMATKMRSGVKSEEDRERDEKRRKIRSQIDDIRRNVTDTYAGIAATLNQRGVPPLRRGQWHARQIQRILEEPAGTGKAGSDK